MYRSSTFLLLALFALFVLAPATGSVSVGQVRHVTYHRGAQFHPSSQPSFAAPRPMAPLNMLNAAAHQTHHDMTSAAPVASSGPLGSPNAYIHVTSGILLSRLEQRQVTRDPVYDVILGTSLQGEAMAHTNVTPQLLPSEQGIEVALHFHTRAFTNTTGTNNAATAYNRGLTKIHGRKQILLTPERFFTNNAHAHANTTSEIVGFKWDRPIGERIARQRAAEQKPTTERISEKKAADRARMQFDRQVDRQVVRFESQYRQALQQQLPLLPQQPTGLRFRSTHNTMVAEATFGTGAANSHPPSLLMNGSCQGIAVQIHESLIGETLSRLNDTLAGQSLDEKDWSKRLAEFIPARAVPAESLKVSNNRRQWKLGMPKEEPLKIEMVDQAVKVSLKIDAFQVGESKYPGMLIESLYKPEIKDGKVIAKRGEKLQLTPLDEDGNTVRKEVADKEPSAKKKSSKGRLGVRQQIFRSMVRKRFDPIFAEELPLGDQRRTFANNQMTISRIELANGWATIQGFTE